MLYPRSYFKLWKIKVRVSLCIAKLKMNIALYYTVLYPTTPLDIQQRRISTPSSCIVCHLILGRNMTCLIISWKDKKKKNHDKKWITWQLNGIWNPSVISKENKKKTWKMVKSFSSFILIALIEVVNDRQVIPNGKKNTYVS